MGIIGVCCGLSASSHQPFSKMVSIESSKARRPNLLSLRFSGGWERLRQNPGFPKTAMNAHFTEMILQSTGATGFEVEECLQELWSGYGQILRLTLEGAAQSTAVAKWISLPEQANHPRGWDTDRSHQRKVRSYEVESHWYRHYNSACGVACRTPRLLGHEQLEGETCLLLEDLDDAGFSRRCTELSWQEVAVCLRWLAEFHATFLREDSAPPEGLWEVGTYWHLATRPDEWNALEDLLLKEAAQKIDETLSGARFQTLVHGDAKLANFCFSEDKKRVAALDFQYVGGGCGMKDVAYFLGSCLEEDVLLAREEELLESYFQFLTAALQSRGNPLDPSAVIAEWRELFPFAWTDFHRFLKGWCPTHWKLNQYSEEMSDRVFKAF